MMKLVDLFEHDNIIESIVIDIYENEFIFFVGLFGTKTTAKIVFKNLSSIKIDNLRPWGPSISINESTYSGDRLILELQSGDVINIFGISDYSYEIQDD